jgi:hypothetical protein
MQNKKFGAIAPKDQENEMKASTVHQTQWVHTGAWLCALAEIAAAQTNCGSR